MTLLPFHYIFFDINEKLKYNNGDNIYLELLYLDIEIYSYIYSRVLQKSNLK